jgi:hypothetical protein
MGGGVRCAIAREPADVYRERAEERENFVQNFFVPMLQSRCRGVWSGLVSASEPDEGVFRNFVHGGFSSFLVVREKAVITCPWNVPYAPKVSVRPDNPNEASLTRSIKNQLFSHALHRFRPVKNPT